ncbi:unnamed protein product [Ilex paraguariensis]|uniref:Uncharacterized protein n=2 Tax=Ilex paraguariensis TaxID=185542 RepID=A0ABC8UZJ3_9AQUA
MASSEADSRLNQVLIPALDKIIKNGSWRKHSKLVHQAKSVLERLNSPEKPQTPISPDQSELDTSSLPGVLGPSDISLADSEFILTPFINACSSNNLKIAEPALDAIQKLIAHGYLHGEADPTGGPEAQFLSKLIESVCKCQELNDEAVELLLLKTILSAVTSVSLRIHGDCLLQIVRTGYDIYLASKNVVNQTTAKASLIQMLVIVFRRMEADSSTVPVQPIVVAELMEPTEKAEVDGNMTVFVQGFISKIIQDIDGVINPSTPRKGLEHDGAFETMTRSGTVENLVEHPPPGMASSEADSRLNQVLIPALDKIIKNGSWRKHSKLVHQAKSVLERLNSPEKPQTPISPDQSELDTSSLPGVLGPSDISLADSEFILTPFINACSSNNLKIAEPALDAIQKLIAHGYLHGEADPTGGPEAQFLSKLIESVCKCQELNDEAVELLLLKTILSAVTSVSLRIHGDCLLQIVRTGYDIYLASKNVVNQTTAKASLIQMLVIVFRRMEADSSTVPVQPIVVAELMEPTEKAEVDGNMTVFVQGFISKIIQDIDGVINPSTPRKGLEHDGAFETMTRSGTVESTNPADLLDSTDKDMLDAKYWEISMYKTALEGRKGELADGEMERDEDLEVQIGNKLRRDAFLVFRALCKLSMKTPPKEALADPQLMRGKIVALELLKILLENAGAVFRTSEREYKREAGFEMANAVGKVLSEAN